MSNRHPPQQGGLQICCRPCLVAVTVFLLQELSMGQQIQCLTGNL